MRRSAFIPSVLAGLALALGGTVIAAPAAHADIAACENQVRDQGTEVTDAVRMGCYVGLVGDQSGCVGDLTRAGVAGAVAIEACRQSPE
ncbi:hypothetical protein ACFWD7_31520 [Streptomyces mirabilis]|uniref:hypothetical protein n=1 Tax=Streptomyces mirabilis TaxID=68239 RepID=UPI0021C16740|nr:hypothetical protein [Streptomyces mirabilis]MCT9112539.1 hypothetical protein [Streptomyces mirabilis]